MVTDPVEIGKWRCEFMIADADQETNFHLNNELFHNAYQSPQLTGLGTDEAREKDNCNQK